MICPKCHVLSNTICPVCGNRSKLRKPEENEPVLLITLSALQAMFVEPVLHDNEIPYSKQGLYGGALTAQAGMMGEIYRFYVPYSAWKKSRAKVEQIFIEDPEIMRALHEMDEKTE